VVTEGVFVRFLKMAGLGLGILAGAVLAWRRGVENTQKLTLTHETVIIPDLPPSFDGFRVLQLSDLHLRRFSTIGDTLLAQIEAIDPDIVCLTGDYLYTALSLPELDDFLFGLSQRPAVVGVYGNSDYRPGITREVRAGWASYFPFLVNGAMQLERNGESLWVVGVDDPHKGRDDLAAAMTPVPADAKAILLAHSPEIILRPLDPRVKLIMSGHTHGGQICMPWGGGVYTNTSLSREFIAGRHQVDDAVLYINRGIGSTRLPVRYACLPEVTVFTLRRAATE